MISRLRDRLKNSKFVETTLNYLKRESKPKSSALTSPNPSNLDEIKTTTSSQNLIEQLKLNNLVEKSINMKTDYIQTAAVSSPMREDPGDDMGLRTDIGTGNLVTLSGLTRDACLFVLNYYDGISSLTTRKHMWSEEFSQIYDYVKYRLDNKLPLEKELIIDMFPILFHEEARDLAMQRKYMKLQGKQVRELDMPKDFNSVESYLPIPRHLLNKQQRELYDLQNYEREMDKLVTHFYMRFYDTLNHNMKIHSNVKMMFWYLKNHPNKSNLREKEMLYEAQVIHAIEKNRVKRIENMIEEHQSKILMPFEPSEALKQKVIEAAVEIDQESVDMEHVIPTIKYESNILKKLRSNNIDLNDLIENSRKQYALKVEEEGTSLQNRNRNDKDHDLINKMAFMSGLLDVESPGTVVPTATDEDEVDKGHMKHSNPESGRILMRHLIKMFYLNYEDPKKYNIKFFAENFEIHPRDLRSILLYMSCPVYQQKTVVDQLQFNFIDLDEDIYEEKDDEGFMHSRAYMDEFTGSNKNELNID